MAGETFDTLVPYSTHGAGAEGKLRRSPSALRVARDGGESVCA